MTKPEYGYMGNMDIKLIDYKFTEQMLAHWNYIILSQYYSINL